MSSASTGGTEGSSPASSPASAASLAMAAPKYGTLVPNRIFVGGIPASTSEPELAQLFSGYGNVRATKIIADRAGVSKGYGFVTFETEEEAKRPQQESESIILRERKLNIAPAIKKQTSSRSFDGGTGSPPAVPSNTYYYPNGMGLTYQNGMAFYSTGAPAPPTPVAPPTDPATIYQATSIFGPQATAGHQTFAPVMYPCPAPSLFVPQQYQYSPMPYEQYYPGAASTGTPSYLYSSNTQNSSTTGGNGTGGGSNGTGAASLPAGSLPPLTSLPVPQPGHYYAPAPPTPHHHPPVPTGPPPPQMDQVYYSFTTGPPPTHPPHTPIGLADQQLLLYTTDASCQPSQCDGQSSTQEESRSTSSHSDQLHGETPSAQVSGSATPLVPLVPLKFPMSSRYTNYHPIAIHATNLHGSQTCLSDTGTDEANVNQMHCRTIVYHPTTVYIPHSHASPYHQPGTGGSLLPTPLPSSRNAVQSGPKIHNNPINRDYSKAVAVANAQNNFVKSQNLSIALISSSSSFTKNQNINVQAPNKYAGTELTHKFTANVSSSNRYPVHQYANKRGSSSNLSSTYFHSQKTHYGNVNYQKPVNFGMNVAHSYGQPSYHQKSGNFHNSGQNLDYANGGRRLSNYGSDQYLDSTNSRSKNTTPNYKSGTNCSVNQQSDGYNNSDHFNNSGSQSNAKNATGCANKQSQRSNVANDVVDKSVSPPPAPYSPMTRPLPTLSPPIPQVQFYASPAQNRYQSVMHPSQTSGHQQPGQRRYTGAPPLPAGRKASEKYLTSSNSGSSTIRQPKYKPNGLMQPAGKVSDENIGGAGDAPPGVGRMPITPPGTPQNHTGAVPGDQNQSSDPCHQMQTLAL